MNFSGLSGDVLMQLMSAASLRAKVIAHNIGNQSTPGYQRKEVRFEDALLRELARKDPRPMTVEPEVIVDSVTPPGADGNNVSLEEELSAMKENQLLYELYATMAKSKSNIIRGAINGDR